MKDILAWLRDTLWPNRCIACDEIGEALCSPCRERIPSAPDVRRLADGTRAISGGPLAHPLLAQAVWRLKYRSLTALAGPLACWLADAVAQTPEALQHTKKNAVVVPVPLHPSRFRERGYNQAELIARAWAHITALPCDATALTRTRNTGSQVATADRGERLENMRDAFACNKPAAIRGRAVMLVDDVCTTGATLQACARALRAAGARSVTALTVARG
ncbi:MAG: ComF family protein [Candidatus Yanofskybacteria bacterium]|nr:ComF family protein [Candidatus Yanofskybacteria bacterium]